MTPFYEMDDEVPQLDPVLVADDLELAEVIELVIQHDPVAVQRTAEIDDYMTSPFVEYRKGARCPS